MESSPVLVIGAGPVGLAAALSLAKSGVHVRIIDRLLQPTAQSRAAVVHARTLEMLERLGAVDDFLTVGVRIHGAAVYGPGGKLLTRPNMDGMPTNFSYMLGIDQCETERILSRNLMAAGIGVERGVEVLALGQTESEVKVRLKYPDGTEKEEEFEYVLGADGARSVTRHALGLTLEGETLDTMWVTADVKMNWSRSPDEAIACLVPGGFAFIAPMNGNRWRVIINVEKMTPAEASEITLDQIQQILNERFQLDVLLYDQVWISPFGINTRIAQTMRVGRVFLAGDASHVHSPVGGQGMNTGIQDALNLGWKLALVVRGGARAEILESYNVERHGNAKRLLAVVGPATKVINLRHPVPVEIRNFVMRMVYDLGLSSNMAKGVSMLEVAYPDSPITEEHHGKAHDPVAAIAETLGHFMPGHHAVKPGQRAPDAHGMDVGAGEPGRLFELWKGDQRHQLLIFSGPGADPVAVEGLASLVAGFGEFSDFLKPWLVVPPGYEAIAGAIIDSDLDAHSAYGVHVPTLCLVRPDGYVAFRSTPPDREALLVYLKKWFKIGG